MSFLPTKFAPLLQRRIWILQRLSFTLMLLLVTVGWFGTQSAVQTQQATARKIVSDDFTKNRQQTPDTKERKDQASSAKSKQQRRTYRLASTPATSTSPKTSHETLVQLGITIWRLRPKRVNDTGARMLVREKSKTSQWVPERVEADTRFHEGDQVRLSIESAQPGYLYVVDREFFADGANGPAMLIYPWTGMSGDNRVGPGQLVDIPAQEDEPSYFTARRSTPNQAGELLTIIVTNSPLSLPISDKPLQISNAEIATWEKMWGAPAERFEMEGGAGETWTKEEQEAAAHTSGRQLTREDPAPQTIYRISVAKNKTLLVNVRLHYDK